MYSAVPTFLCSRIHDARRLASTSLKRQFLQIGSGPFRFMADEFQPGNRVVYTKFEEYVPR